jgi:hypothetical protein
VFKPKIGFIQRLESATAAIPEGIRLKGRGISTPVR